MISTQEQERCDVTAQRFEEMRKVMKTFQKYLSENCTELDQQNKKLQSMSKTSQGNLIISKEDPLALSSQITEIIQLFEFGSKIQQQQIQEFSGFFNAQLDEYFEKQSASSKRVNDLNKNNLKQVLEARQNHLKAKKKYESLCKEVETNIEDKKKSYHEANSGYNIELASKSGTRIRDTIKQIETAEQVYKDQTETVQVRTKELYDGLIESSKQLNIMFKYTHEKMLEITMKQDQHNLLTFNWMKGQVDDRVEKAQVFQKLDTLMEDLMVQAKIDSKEQDIVLKQTNMRYIDILKRLMGEVKSPVQDLEYMWYPELLQRFIDVQNGYIQDRVKNLKFLSQFFSDLMNTLDTLQKNITKQNKNSLAYVQEKLSQSDNANGTSGYGKKLLQIHELIAAFFEAYSKKLYQFCQFLQMKQSALENLIKDQKNQEKSFVNMYQKMIKDLMAIRSQLQGLMLDGSDYKNAQAQRDSLTIQLRKMITEGAPILKYSLEQIRVNENTRSQQVNTILEGISQQFLIFIEEMIKTTKQQEETLNKRYDSVEQDMALLPQLQQPADTPEYPFTKIFQMTEELQKQIDLAPVVVAQSTEASENNEEDENLGEGATKVSQKLRDKFQVHDQKCIASYACAFQNKILLQGRIYIFPTRICFHSYFNAKTLIGTTVLLIPPNDIITIKKYSYLFDNAIEINTVKGSLIFASFLNRDSTIQNMRNVRGLAEGVFEEPPQPPPQPPPVDTAIPAKQEQDIKQEEVEVEVKQSQVQFQYVNYILKAQQKSAQKPQSEQQIITNPVNTLEKQVSQPVPKVVQNENFQQQKQPEPENQKQKLAPVLKLEPVVSKFDVTAPAPKAAEPAADDKKFYNEIMINKKADRYISAQNYIQKVELPVNLVELTELIFNGSPFTKNGKTYQGGFFEYLAIGYCKDKEVQWQAYSPQPKWENQVVSKRTLNFLHPVREKVMFAPEFATCQAVDTLYIFNRNEVYLEREISFFKIPYGDHFKFRGYYLLKQVADQNKSTIEYGFHIAFVKSTVWKSKIESSSKAENIELWDQGIKPLILEAVQAFNNKKISRPVEQISNVELQQPLPSIERIQEPQLEEEKQVEETKVENIVPKENIIKEQIQQVPTITETKVEKYSSSLEDKIDKLQSTVYLLICLVAFNLLITLFK